VIHDTMKIVSFFLSTASADLLVPAHGTNPIVLFFPDAVTYCKDNFDGHLVDPNNYVPQQLLDATHGLFAWVGIYRSSAQPKKFFPVETVASFETLVAAPEYAYNTFQWAIGEPNNHEGKQYCGQIYPDGTLDDQNCYTPLPFLCEGTYQRSRSGAAHAIIDAESAAIIRENQQFENQRILYNDFLDEAIQKTHELSPRHAHYLRNIKSVTNHKIQFEDRELCGESLYVEDRFTNKFYYWNLGRTPVSDHEDVCDIYRDFHDGITHYIHEFGCTSNYPGDLRDLNRKFTRLLPIFCPDLTVVQKPFGIDF